MRRRSQPGAAPGSVRIIAGKWRGRRIALADVAGLRPTPDRLRETLFNWLAPVLPGARCLDLYAGSGALGLEAASRGAAQVVLVEHDARCVRVLRNEIERLQSDTVELVSADAIEWLQNSRRRFDIVFLDPPYAADLLKRSITLLNAGDLLADESFVYLEHGARAAPPALPERWRVHRESRAGHAHGVLARLVGD